MNNMRAKKPNTTRLKWLEEKINKLDLTGRDEFYTHLLRQEIPFWVQDLKYGKKIVSAEVSYLIRCRGFNRTEAIKFRKLVRLLNANSRKIMESFKDLKMSLNDFLKELFDELKDHEHKTLFKEQWRVLANL